MITQKAFEDFLTQKVNLTSTEVSHGSKSHNRIRELLSNKSQSDGFFPWLTSGDFLSGSYARSTKIRPLDDIDVMIVIDGTGLVPIKGGVRLNAIVRGDGKVGSPVLRYNNEWGHISSTKILDVFKNALKESYPSSDIRKDGQAINVKFDSCGLGLDIVPCFHILPRDGQGDYYYIPYGTGSDMWRSTNPKIDERICDALNDRCNKKLKPLIKLIKYWNQSRNSDRLKSYHIEVLAWNILSRYSLAGVVNYTGLVKHFFNNAIAYLRQPCEDPTCLGDYIDSYLEPLQKEQTISEIKRTKQIIDMAIKLSVAGQTQRAIGQWRLIFGNQFGS